MMDEEITNAGKEILVEVVRSIQKRGLKGNKGGWKEFLDYYDRQFGAGLSDPSKRSINMLVAFLQTFTEEEDCKLLKNMIRSRGNQAAIEQFVKEFPDQESSQQRLVRMTVENPQYVHRFSFSDDKDWLILPLGKKIKKIMKSKTLIAIDCEMVLCEDGTDALVRVCAVDRKLEVKVDELVKPNKAITDYRTDITGISASDLERVTCSLEDVQKSLEQVLAPGSILVGHGLHNDLKALKIVHPRVIDTSYIFKYKDLPPGFVPSLNNLCKAVLGYEVRKEGEPHDCLNDAKAAMKLVLAKLEQGFDDPIPIEGKKMSQSDLAKLLLHKIPFEIPYQELRNIFPMEYNIGIQADLIKVRGPCYSTYAVFKDEMEADAVFRKIEGQESQDSCGRAQKHVSLKLSNGEKASFYVRKMRLGSLICETEPQKKRFAQDGCFQDSKRQRTSDHPCELVKEIESLKQVLQDREEEISNLKKVLFALVSK